MSYAIWIDYAYIEHKMNEDRICLIQDWEDLRDVLDDLLSIFSLELDDDSMHYPSDFFAEDLASKFKVPLFKTEADELLHIDVPGVYYLYDKQKMKYGPDIIEAISFLDDQSCDINLFNIRKAQRSDLAHAFVHTLSDDEAKALDIDDNLFSILSLDADRVYDFREALDEAGCDEFYLKYGDKEFILGTKLVQ